MKATNLKMHLMQIDNLNNKEWSSTLEDRKLKEVEFHNRTRNPEYIQQKKDMDSYDKFYGNRKYYSTVQASSNYVENWIKKNSKDKVYMDSGCGNGSKVILAAKAGAKLAIGLDISSQQIENAKKLAAEAGVEDNTCFIQTDIENSNIPDHSIDVITCCGMLHHIDITYAFPELRRILAPNGRILAIEALEYNPFIKLYRKLTPEMRTDWEKSHILGLKDVKFASRFFDLGEVKYWHVVGYLGALIKPLRPIFNMLDAMLTKIPFVKYMAWIFTFELLSKNTSDVASHH